ncbi:MAG: maleylpyruvate isomerase family mycothiol-dependent enzyme [Actinomycetota bacterium]|nr:maleylpyruvate isomerase family mycothiol-dependent enzyme [Actinomycetota bacterium]
MVPVEEIEACAASHVRLTAIVSGLSDVSIPSRLPDWTVGHVLTHLARNADSCVRRLEAAQAGELVTQYEGGDEGRAAEIAHGAGRPAAEVVADLVASCDRLDALFPQVTDEVWAGEVMAGSSRRIPATRLAFSRWREVEIHLVDLGLGYEAAQWPRALVDRQVPELLEELPERTDPARLMAWALGRGPAPDLAFWG